MRFVTLIDSTDGMPVYVNVESIRVVCIRSKDSDQTIVNVGTDYPLLVTQSPGEVLNRIREAEPDALLDGADIGFIDFEE